MEEIKILIQELGMLEEVEAIALGGSRATGKGDKKSDYDIYVYIAAEIDKNIRHGILSNYCNIMEINNHYWEMEDNCTLKSGVDIDIIYRDLDEFTSGIRSVVEKFNSGAGYTTCMWHNLLTSQILYDKKGRLEAIKKRYLVPYPKQLKDNIIHKNMNLLSGVLPSYDLQIKKAIGRDDLVSINHRVTEFLASYFDIIFALNEMTHPGEKRLLSICKEQCTFLPDYFEENIDKLLKSLYGGEVVNEIVTEIVMEIKKLIKS